VARTLNFTSRHRGKRIRADVSCHTKPLQVVADARVAEAKRSIPRYRGREAFVREQLRAVKLVEHANDLCRIVVLARIPTELLRQLGAAMVAPGKKRNGTAQQASGWLGSTCRGSSGLGCARCLPITRWHGKRPLWAPVTQQ